MSAKSVGVYLDTNVVISAVEALDGQWRPADQPAERTVRQRLAAARIVLYSHRDRPPNWVLVTSGEARRELKAGLAVDWLRAMLPEVDEYSDAADPETLSAEATRYAAAGLAESDAAHVAQASLLPWVRYFVTDDDRLRRRAERIEAATPLTFLRTEQAAELLSIDDDEQAPISPAPTNPLHGQGWWVPGHEHEEDR
jgi:hypothetical protein